MSGPGRRASAPDLRRILEDERFLRGLGLGALIGAAIAGSTIWSRLRGRRDADEAPPSVPASSHEGPRTR